MCNSSVFSWEYRHHLLTSKYCLRELFEFGQPSIENPELLPLGVLAQVIGMKSYGTGSAFLLKVGHQQVLDVMALIKNNMSK